VARLKTKQMMKAVWLNTKDMPFDYKRMLYGGFETIVQA